METNMKSAKVTAIVVAILVALVVTSGAAFARPAAEAPTMRVFVCFSIPCMGQSKGACAGTLT